MSNECENIIISHISCNLTTNTIDYKKKYEELLKEVVGRRNVIVDLVKENRRITEENKDAENDIVDLVKENKQLEEKNTDLRKFLLSVHNSIVKVSSNLF
jgi:predicted  nucleic acid-binding Zn-ribbon protein